MVKEIIFNIPELLPHQAKVKSQFKRFNTLCCARRWGKTNLTPDLLLEPDRDDNGALAGYPVAYFTPTYKMLKEVWEFMVALCAPITKHKSEQDKTLLLITGGKIDFWSLDNINSVRGRKYKRVIIDEAAMILYLKAAWQEVIRPLLTDYKGDAFFLSTPKGKNFFYELFTYAEKFPDEWFSVQEPTSRNPLIDPQEIEAARRTLPPLAFAQEYLAQFVVDNITQWLYAFDADKHVRDHLPIIGSMPIYLSWDFNREPLSCSAWQFSPEMGTPSSFVHGIKEFGGNLQLRELCMQIKSAFPYNHLFVTGDSSGNKGDIGYESRHDSAYSLIRTYLGLSRNQMQPNKSNLVHENSRLLMNTMLQNYPNFLINGKECPNLVNDCEIATVDPTKPHHLLKDRELYKMDFFDGMRYFVQRYFSAFAHKQYFRRIQINVNEDDNLQ